jgi:uncharacterized protein YbbC (DUF1343 family)
MDMIRRLFRRRPRARVFACVVPAAILLSVSACGQRTEPAGDVPAAAPVGEPAKRVRTGAEVLLSGPMASLDGKRVGVVCNHTSVLPNGTHLVDTLLKRGIRVTALFAPEHGIRGTSAAGARIADEIDSSTGLPVYSLYGKTTKPNSGMLSDVDVLIFDIQDIGCRYYTYTATMAFAMEAAAQSGKRFLLLDRPNPINGSAVEGTVLDLGFRSLVGMFPIPARHGLTVGELSGMIIGEGWIDDTRLDLEVVKMEGWRRSMWYDDTGLPWVPPSPNMKTLSTATVYPGMCLIEATNLSEGRGTTTPFEIAGGPGLDGKALSESLNALRLPGVEFHPVGFTPRAGGGAGPDPKHRDRECSGVGVEVTDRNLFRPVLTGLSVVESFERLYPGKFTIREGLMDRLLGSDIVRKKLQEGVPPARLLQLNRADFEGYLRLRGKYLLYGE